MLQLRQIEDNSEDVLVCPSGYALPPFIVMESGESVEVWQKRARPDVWQSVTVRTCLLAVRTQPTRHSSTLIRTSISQSLDHSDSNWR